MVGDHSGAVTCLGPSGRQEWRREVGAAVAGAPDVGPEGAVVACTTEGEVVVLDWRGEERGRVALGGEVFSSPLLLGDRLLVGSRDNFLHCLAITQRLTDAPDQC
jgi:outer membrane protein assembly factor BamB